MTPYELGATVGSAAQDAVALMFERMEDPDLLSCVVVLTCADGDEVRSVVGYWPDRD